MPVWMGRRDRRIWLRPRSTDLAAFDFLSRGYHVPPPDLAEPIRHVAVFGANIGLLLADLAWRYPQARLLGIEPDRDNATVARHNIAHVGDRCSLVEAAVWHRRERLALDWTADAWGLNLAGGPATLPTADGTASGRQCDALDAGALLREFAGRQPVDYLLISIESAWYEMLRHGHWTKNVRCLRVEIQGHYDQAIPLLEALGFRAWLQPVPWGAFVTGIAGDQSRGGHVAAEKTTADRARLQFVRGSRSHARRKHLAADDRIPPRARLGPRWARCSLRCNSLSANAVHCRPQRL